MAYIPDRTKNRSVDENIELISLKEYAEKKFVEPQTVLKWIRKKRVKAWKIYSRWYVEKPL